MFGRFLNRQQTKLGSQLKANMIAIGIVFALFMVGCFSYEDLQFDDSYSAVRQLNLLDQNVESLKEAMIDQETGQRGFALTGESSFLEPYVVGTRTFDQKSEVLNQSLRDYPDLREPIQRMIEAGTLWHNLYGEPVVQARRMGEDLSREDFQAGKEAFDSFREASRDAMMRIETVKTLINSQLERQVDTIWIVIAVISVLIALVALFCVNHKFRKIVRPIVELERGVREYANRNFDVPVPIADGVNELSALIQGVDLMRQELKERFQQTQRLADIDGLTGVPNRRSYDARLEDLVQQAKQGGGTFALVLLDIDNFKAFNDNYGHLEGDVVLRHVAQVLTDNLLPLDMLARYGGEEFAILIPHLERANCLEQTEYLRSVIERESLGSYRITASFGVAEYRAGDSALTLFEKADLALYRAKANGRNRVEMA
ncbi:diguanylate cyclase [Tumebacillus sp. ITR2]|uniref:Diguanylate cyclase n=1 Tax=Tumebacillus amylolyticus TaxID=2801339 RepID=A0ABS1J8L3_9BACL|nr:diguanylate cyclase [Tumebacillus amylolyticus]MBL0386587.1 diguanylate cyclase [Tumebacillus amylolyticus]